jgi:SWIM zinc finger
VAGVEQVYAYRAPSTVAPGGEVTLATSGGREAHPHFFSGFLGAPRQTAQALLVVAEVARTRYYEPPQMVAARILAADPVVTSNVDRVRFESFSACAGVYARLDLEPELLGSAATTWGTTNVDFNPPMRAALAGIRDADAMLMNVGHDEVAVTTLGGTAVEKKVPLPERWVKGFAEVQVAASRMVLRHELTAIEARRFVQSLPRGKSRGLAWATPAGNALRLASRPNDASVCLAGPERLRLLEKLIPFATELRIYGPLPEPGARTAEPSAWELALDGARIVFAVSPELFRGFSGEGGVLVDLAAADEEIVERLADELHGQPEIEVTTSAERLALGALGGAGRVGYDLAKNAFFHRELPYDRSVLEKMHPRLLGAQRLVEEGAVRLDGDSAYVLSGEVEYLVRGERCTCPWFARHRGDRGPCKHVLAVQHARRQVGVGARG